MRGRMALLGALVVAMIVSVAPLVMADSPPEVAINTPDHGSTVSGTVVISGAAGDDVGVVGVKVRIDLGEWQPAEDRSGDGSWSSWALGWDTTTVEDGWHHIGAIAWDTIGQLADAGIEVFVDNDPTQENTRPWVTIDEPPNHSTVRANVTVQGRSGDEDANDTVELVVVKIDAGEWANATPSGEGWGHWSFLWDTSTVEDGWHSFAARSFDGELYSEPVIYEYYVDNVQDENRAPIARITHPMNEDTVWGIVLVHGMAEDPDEGDRVELVQVRIGDGEWQAAVDTSHDDSWRTWAYQWDTRERDNGLVTICARAYDGDLYGEPSCRTVKVANEHENLRPKVVIVHPKNGQVVEGIVLIHGTSEDDHGVRFVEIRIGDGDWRGATDTSPDGSWATWAYEWNTRERDDGCVYVYARAFDGELFSETFAIKVCVDNENGHPIVKILHPEAGQTVAGIVLIHGTSSDDHGVKLVQVRIDMGEWHEAHNTGRERPWSTWAWEWDTRELENGEHKICARAFDGELYSESHCIVVIVENGEHGGDGLFRAPIGNAAPLLSLGLFGALGVAILMWLRSHGYLRK